MQLKTVTLDDKYELAKSPILLSGIQALVRLMLMQKDSDRRNGLNTAGYVTGYRGSPLGAVDQQFMRAKRIIEANDIRFQAGLNEDLAATAVWGTQQAELHGEGKYDGVFAMWYGKGPGIDRSGDVFRHGNAAGTSKHGGVLVLMGDDHAAESSTVPHQSEFALLDAMMPVLHPAGVQEIIDYGLYGIALSRFAGVWVGLKCVHDNVESTAIVDAGPDRIKVKLPDDFKMPEDGLNIRIMDDRFAQERRLHTHKRFAATAFARANGLNKIVLSGGRAPRIGIVATGKAYLDCRQALDELGIDEVKAADLGLRLLKVGMVWPLDPKIVETFSDGLDMIIVLEEKRALIETQVREQLYGRSTAPIIVGKKDETGAHLFPAFGTLEPHQIALVIGERLLARAEDSVLAARVDAIKAVQANVHNAPALAQRSPYFCAGCPHNTSTRVPDGGRAYGGIGCHWMVQFIPERRTDSATHMGGEGANWIGEAPFSKRPHVFQNLGDGTYNHSGILAIRAAIASGVNITYKILYNDAVAMTGGQAHEGSLTVPMIARQVAAEGVTRIALVSDEPDKYPPNADFPSFVTVHHRDDLDGVQKDLMQEPGVSILIYDQTCAAEKRRRRKRGTFPDPNKRVIINELVCEGCGDCGVKSNCVAVQPVETEFGRKRMIDQSVCNKDFSCVKGFCPSFVTVEGGSLRRGAAVQAADRSSTPFEVLPEPVQPDLDQPYAMLITGIGGTGVVTVGAILGMAAHLEGKGAGIIDMAGLSQKNGAVVTHMKIAMRPDDIQAIRVSAGGADLLLGCDLVTTGSPHILTAASRERTRAIVNSHEIMPANFTRDADYQLPSEQLKVAIGARSKPNGVDFVDATKIATALMGDSIASNLFTLGYAYQKGLIPVSAQAIDRAIELNGVAIEMNRKAFLWGRRAAHDLALVEQLIAPPKQASKQITDLSQSLDEMIERRAAFLTGYQDKAYANRYRNAVQKVRLAESKIVPGREELSIAVARYLFKLMAYKDEYEVARLYSDGAFKRKVASQFTGDYKLKVHLAPPVLSPLDPASGEPRKREFGPWMFKAFSLLAPFKRLRGTRLDLFGYTQERRMERQLRDEYEAQLDDIIAALTPQKHALLVELASLPEQIRGYGHIKAASLVAVQAAREKLLARLRAPAPERNVA